MDYQQTQLFLVPSCLGVNDIGSQPIPARGQRRTALRRPDQRSLGKTARPERQDGTVCEKLCVPDARTTQFARNCAVRAV